MNKFWEAFYWLVAFSCIGGGAAVLFGGWPSLSWKDEPPPSEHKQRK